MSMKNMFTLIFLAIILQTWGGNIEDSFNILMKDSAVYLIDEFLCPDDYEMVDSHNETNKKDSINEMLTELNKLAEEEYKNTIKTSYEEDLTNVEDTIKQFDKPDITVTNHVVHKRDSIASDKEKDYDYDDLLNDYIGIDNSDGIVPNDGSMNKIGCKNIICLINDTLNQPPKLIIVRLWNDLKVWLLVYLAVAVPLWCTKGWCCCCLFCKFLKPQRTIEDAKRYYMMNPPGLLIVPNSDVIRYEPTEREKETYEKFGHIIRTI